MMDTAFATIIIFTNASELFTGIIFIADLATIIAIVTATIGISTITSIFTIVFVIFVIARRFDIPSVS